MAAGSTIGTIFKVTTWGESHGKAIGVVVDGCPAGLPLDESDIQKLLDRRKPGQSRFTTQRKEGDEVEILSGVFEGKTTGTPISMIVRNTDQRSSVPKTTPISLPVSARVMRIIPLRKNTGSATTAAADVPPPGRPSAASQQVPSQRSS